MTTQLKRDVELAESVGFVTVNETDGQMYVGMHYDIHALCNAVREQAMPQWISVEDKLPKNNDDVLGKTQSDFMVAYYDQRRWQPSGASYGNYNEGGYGTVYEGKVTHWMPLPAAPTREDE